jgi:hypothetical protein
VTKIQGILEVFEKVIIDNSSPISFKAALCKLENLLVQTKSLVRAQTVIDPCIRGV